MIIRCLKLVLFSVFASFAGGGHAWAGLGEDRSMLEKDKKHLGYTHQSQLNLTASHKPYTVDQLSLGNESVMEYHTLDGVCFAVTWVGSVQPEISSLLGKYSDEHAKALTNRPTNKLSRRFGRVESANITVERFGVANHFSGRAYVPALIPAGVSLDEIH